jgi:diguanylate cyclase (GGDEF)-like protein/PAS domain S-box-containing protein
MSAWKPHSDSCHKRITMPQYRLVARLEALPLRMRFMVAPILGLLLLALLTAGFVSESRRQGALIDRVAREDLQAINDFTEAFIGLSRAHGALFDQLGYVRERLTQDKVAELAQIRLEAVRAAVTRLQTTIEKHQRRDIEAGRDLSPEAELLKAAKQYLVTAETAVDIATAEPRVAAEQLGIANERFVAVSGAFNGFLDHERIELRDEMTGHARHSETDTVLYGIVGLALAVFLLLFALVSSRLFARSLDRQLDALVELGREAGVQATEGRERGHELDRIAAAIAMFRAAVMKMRGDERELTKLNAELHAAQGDLERRVQERTRELSATNAKLSREVGERSKAQEALERASRSYAALSETNKAILHVTDKQRLFLAVCRIAVEEGGIGAASVSLLDTTAGTIEPLIRWGDETLVDIALAAPYKNAIASAVLKERPYVANDLAREDSLGAGRERRTASRSAAWFPLFEGGRGIAVMSLHCTEAGFFDAQVIALFAEMVDNISFALDNIELDRVRAQTEEALRLRQRAIEASVNAVMIASATRPGFPLEYVNPAYEAITGYTAAEVIGRSGEFLLGDDGAQAGLEHVRAALRERREGRALLRNYRKDGRLFWNDLRLAPVRDDSGAVTHIVGVMNDVTEAKTYQEQLEHQANHDALTNLPNRNLMRDRLEQALAYAQRQDHSVAVAVLDLDHFKLVNDSLGHSAGDELLTTAARRIQSCLRGSDTLARLGGDEFVLIMPDCGTVEADLGIADMLRRIQRALAAPIRVVERSFHVSCSIGVSLFPQDSRTIEGLLQQADAAMYEAKAQGRARFHFYSADLNQRINRRIELEGGMRRALEQREFALHYQPKLDLQSGEVIGAEALLRWKCPERGNVSPGEFIPLAEETGLIVQIGNWVLRTACAQMAEWRAAGLPELTLAVNLSPRQIHSKALIEHVSALLVEHRLPPSSLELEITETAMAEDPERIRHLLNELSERGIGLAIDDFGTGYSSLAYLKRFRANTLKIDRAFVRDIAIDAGDVAMTSAIVAMARNLGMRTVAEGVETEAQMQRLRALGCDEMQGFLFSPALPPDQFAQLVKDGRKLDVGHQPIELRSRKKAAAVG